MAKTFLTMSNQDLNRYGIINRLIEKEINGSDASKLTGLSKRQIRRLKKAVKQFGPKGLVHGNKGKESNNKIPEKEKKKIIKLLNEKYYDLWPTHAGEKLEENHGIKRDPKTIRKIMISEGLWKPKKIKKKEHREWRQRKAFYGEMEQFDGSYHKWFEDGLEGKQCLLLSVDDATSQITFAEFGKDEGVFSVFNFWLKYLQNNGKPMSIYTDRFSTYKMTQKQAMDNHDTKTQFQRAMEELKIEPIFAHSPEAKGRVERTFGILQNRLVKEMRLKKIKTIEKANLYLKEDFIPKYNKKHFVESRGKCDIHKPLTKTENKQLDSIFSRQTTRTIQNDFTISFKNEWYQLTKEQPVTIQKRDKITVEEKTDNTVKIKLRGKYLNYKIIPKGIKKIKKDIPWVIPATPSKNKIKSKVGHF